MRNNLSYLKTQELGHVIEAFRVLPKFVSVSCLVWALQWATFGRFDGNFEVLFFEDEIAKWVCFIGSWNKEGLAFWSPLHCKSNCMLYLSWIQVLASLSMSLKWVTLCRRKSSMENRFPTDDAKLMMPKSSVGSPCQIRSIRQSCRTCKIKEGLIEETTKLCPVGEPPMLKLVPTHILCM